MAIRPYDRPPGVVVTEVPEKSLNPIIATPDQLCIVGPASGSIEVKELVTVYGCSGVVTIANNSDTVTGLNTNFTSALVGKYLNINITNDTATNKAYKIASVLSATSLTLAAPVGASNGVTKVKYTIGTPLTQIATADIFVADSDTVYDLDSLNAQAINSAYTSNSGYPSNSYIIDRINKTIAKKQTGLTKSTATIGTARLFEGAALTAADTTISAIGNIADFPSSGTIVIDDEQITYSAVTLVDPSVTQNEVQTVTLSDTPTAGSFRLSYDQEYITVNYNSTAKQVQDALEALPGLTDSTGDANEIQTVTFANATGGTYTLSFDGQTTSPIAYSVNAPAADVATALKALSNIGDNDVTVTGSNGGPYTVTFVGDLGQTNVPQMTANGASLTGTSPTVTVATQTAGTNHVAVTKSNNVYTITFSGTLASTNVYLCNVTNNTLTNSSGASVTATSGTTTHGGAKFNFTVTQGGRGANKTTASTHTDQSVITAGIVIPDSRSVYIDYSYTPENYFRPVSLRTSSEIETRFGTAYKIDANGNETTEINSPLTLAAKIAIENGAQDIILQPLFYSENDINTNMPTRSQPSNDNATSTSGIGNTWAKSFRSLQNVENIGVIVAVAGQDPAWNYGTGSTAELGDSDQLAILQTLQQHIAYMDSEYDQLIIGVVGEDSTKSTTTTTYAARSDMTSHLQTLQNYSYAGKSYSEQIVFVAQTAFKRPSSIGANITVNLGGQYAAAAVAGKLVSYKPNVSLTRKTIAGFKTVEDPSRSKKQKTEDSRNGFFVLEQNPNDGTIVVRHALTANNELWSKSELNAVRSKHAMIRSLRQTIENQVIGQVIADDTAPITLNTIVGSTLRTLQDDGVIVQFDGVQAQVDKTNPTEFGIRFNYRPTFAVSYVNITFSVDLSSGLTSLTANEQTTL